MKPDSSYEINLAGCSHLAILQNSSRHRSCPIKDTVLKDFAKLTGNTCARVSSRVSGSLQL